MVAARLSLSSLQGISKGRWAAIILGTGGAGYVGLAVYRWQRRHKEQRKKKESGRWSSVTQFSSGVALGVVAMVISPALQRWGSPRPNQVLSSVLPKIRANGEVRDAVGSSLKPGLFRAYMYDGGVRWNGVQWGGVKLSGVKQSIRHLVTFHPYTLHLLFQVHGEVSSAMVSLAVRNHTLWGHDLVYKSLVVDLPNGERLVLKGNTRDSIIHCYSGRLP